MTDRQCGGCTLCCKLVPVHELQKAAGERCRHQQTGKGCAVYRKPGMPMSCALWSCRWLVNDDTAELRRPDRSRYVIDIMPDFVVITNVETGERTNVEVIQIWCDPKARDAWRIDDALLDYIERRGREGKAALIRYSNNEGCTVFPPSMSDDGQFHVQHSKSFSHEHTFDEKLAGIASAKHVKVGA